MFDFCRSYSPNESKLVNITLPTCLPLVFIYFLMFFEAFVEGICFCLTHVNKEIHVNWAPFLRKEPVSHQHSAFRKCVLSGNRWTTRLPFLNFWWLLCYCYWLICNPLWGCLSCFVCGFGRLRGPLHLNQRLTNDSSSRNRGSANSIVIYSNAYPSLKHRPWKWMIKKTIISFWCPFCRFSGLYLLFSFFKWWKKCTYKFSTTIWYS